MESVTIWMLLAGLTALVTYILYKRGRIKASTAIILPILVFYFSFILTITILERTPSRSARYELDLFWSYKRILSETTALLAENFWNVVLFVPLATMLSIIFDARAVKGKRRWIWMTVFVCILISAGIEIVQLITHRGLFEFDDIIHNTIAAVIGAVIVVVLRRRVE